MYITIDQKIYIRNNYQNLTTSELATYLNLSKNQIASFCRNNKMKKEKPKKIIKSKYLREPLSVPMKTGKFWPPDHTNKSREDIINFYLSESQIDPNGPTGHGDICFSDADPGL